MASFPSYISIQQYSEQLGRETVRRTPMEAGYIQQTKRFYNIWIDAAVEILMTDTQYETFLDFFQTTINNGSDTFLMVT
jgi:hypothetical protein